MDAHKTRDFDPQAQLHEKLVALNQSHGALLDSHNALHIKFDQMLEHLRTIAGAVQAPSQEPPPNAPEQPQPSAPSQSSPESGTAQT